MSRFSFAAVLCGTLGFAGYAPGAFVLLDGFDGYNLGNLAPQSAGWWDTSTGSHATVGLDPTSPNNQVLVQGDGGDQWIRFNDGLNLVPDGSVGTFFFQVYAPGGAHNGIGLSPAAAADNWSHGKPILRIGEDASNQKFFGRNGNSYTLMTDQTQAGAWYNVWMVADNTANRQASYYIQSDDDPTFATQTEIGSDLAFRNNVPDGDLLSVFFRSAGTGTGTLYFDNFQIDSTGENLATPDLRNAMVAYREIFPNPSTAADLPLSTAGWNSRWGDSAANVPRQEVARANGSPADAVPISSDPANDGMAIGYLVTHPGGSYNSDPVLHWTDEFTIDRGYWSMYEAQWRQRNTSAGDATQVAVRIEDDWFVSEQSFSNASAGSWDLMRLNFGRASWLELDFEPDSLLALGDPASLPAIGDITAFGLFVDNAVDTHRIDSFTIFAVPEPTSAVLLVVAGLCLALGRRRRRH